MTGVSFSHVLFSWMGGGKQKRQAKNHFAQTCCPGDFTTLFPSLLSTVLALINIDAYFTRLILTTKNFLDQPQPYFLTQLGEILAQLVCNKHHIVTQSPLRPHPPDSPLLLGLAMKELRGNPLSPGMSKLDTAKVAKDFCASFLLGH